MFVNVCVCVCVSKRVCDLRTSTNSQSSPQFGCSSRESNTNSTYRHTISNRPLLPAPRQCGCFRRVGHFIGHISESAVRVANHHILTDYLTGAIAMKHSITHLCSAHFYQKSIPHRLLKYFVIYRLILKCLQKLQD